jgi:hypothetical protein
MNDFFLIWKVNNVQYTGEVALGSDAELQVQDYYFPISFPGQILGPITVTLQSCSSYYGIPDNLTNVRFFLDGDPNTLSVIRDLWPALGNSYAPARPDVAGGMDISLDQGQTWTRITTTVGNKDIPSTWIPMPATAVGYGATAGQIGPFDTATILCRLVIPTNAQESQLFDINLAIDPDIV